MDGYAGTTVRWRDGSCALRSAHLVRNDQVDPSGHYGGYLRRYTYADRVIDGSFDQHPGWGYAVSHFDDTAALSYDHTGTWSTPLRGRHHVVHQFVVELPIDGYPVTVTLQWFFATGRDHPVWAITYDSSAAPANAIVADSRSPYGDLQWDDGVGAEVDGVGWGDSYRFRSLGAPITANSGWDYSQPNRIPHVVAWSESVNATMGAVQTQSQLQHAAGGYWFYDRWGDVEPKGPMPESWNWTYQLNQYELPWGSVSKRLAWGMNYGAVGQDGYVTYGYQGYADGYPYQSYAVHMVLGYHADQPVERQISQVEALLDATISMETGTLRTAHYGGAGRTDLVPTDPPGYDPTVGGYHIDAPTGVASWSVATKSPWESPQFVLHGVVASAILLDGERLVPDQDVFVSQDGPVAWVTLARTLDGTHQIEIR